MAMGRALKHVLYIYNHSAHAALKGKTLFEVCFGSALDVSNIWEWGSVVYVHQDTKGYSKLKPHTLEVCWIGLDTNSNSHQIYWPSWCAITVEQSVCLSTHQMHTNKGEPDIDTKIGPVIPDMPTTIVKKDNAPPQVLNTLPDKEIVIPNIVHKPLLGCLGMCNFSDLLTSPCSPCYL
jgi:hypothetical protein